MTKRTQAERAIIAGVLISTIWDEVRSGNNENILQDMVYIQADVNRIIWKLNEMQNEEVRNEASGYNSNIPSSV